MKHDRTDKARACFWRRGEYGARESPRNLYACCAFRANLAGANLGGFAPGSHEAKISLAGADLRRARLDGARLGDIDKSGADFTAAVMGGDELLGAGLRPATVVAHPSGALSVQALTTVWHWPTGLPDAPSVRYALPRVHEPWWSELNATVFPWGEGNWGYATKSGGRLIEARTASACGVVPQNIAGSVRWQGRQAVLVRRSTTLEFEVVVPGTAEVLAHFTAPSTGELLYLNSGSWGVVLMDMTAATSVARVMRLDEERVEWETMTAVPVPNHHFDMRSGEGAVLALCGSEPQFALDLRTMTVVSRDDGLSAPETLRPSHATGFEFDARSGLAAMATTEGIVAWHAQRQAAAPLWQAEVPAGVLEVAPPRTAGS